MDEAVADERERDHGASEDDGAQQQRRRVPGTRTRMRAAAHAQPRLNCQRARRPSNLIELYEHRLRPVDADQAAARELRGRATAEPDRGRLRRGCAAQRSPEPRTSAARTASANTNSAAMTHPEARADAGCAARTTGRVANVGCVLEPSRRQAIQMSRRPTDRRPFLPLRLQQPTVAKPHEDGIERTRPQPDLQPQLVAIPPNRRVGSQGARAPSRSEETDGENEPSLNSTYIEIEVKEARSIPAG